MCFRCPDSLLGRVVGPFLHPLDLVHRLSGGACRRRAVGEGRIVAAEGTELTVAGLDGFASGWFAGGYLTWTSGGNAGTRMRVAAHDGTRLVLNEPPVMPAAPDDTFRILAGCDKSFATCKAKFGNGVNFRGFPHLPGNDAAYTYAGTGSEYDGSALVP